MGLKLHNPDGMDVPDVDLKQVSKRLESGDLWGDGGAAEHPTPAIAQQGLKTEISVQEALFGPQTNSPASGKKPQREIPEWERDMFGSTA